MGKGDATKTLFLTSLLKGLGFWVDGAWWRSSGVSSPKVESRSPIQIVSRSLILGND